MSCPGIILIFTVIWGLMFLHLHPWRIAQVAAGSFLVNLLILYVNLRLPSFRVLCFHLFVHQYFIYWRKMIVFFKNSLSCVLHKMMPGSCVTSSVTPWNTKTGRDFTNKQKNCRESILTVVQTGGQTCEVVNSTSLTNNVGTRAAQEVVSTVQDMLLPSIVSSVDAKADGNVFGDSMKEINSKDLEFIGCRCTEEEVHSEKETGFPNGKPYYNDHVAEKEFVDSGANRQDITFVTHKKKKGRTKKSKCKADSSRHRPRKDCNAENMEFAKEIIAQESFSTEKSVSKMIQGRGEAFDSGRILKLRENNGIPFIKSKKEQLSTALSVGHKNKNKLSDVSSLCSERKSKPSKLHKDINKVDKGEPQRDFAVIPHVQQVESTAHVLGSISTEREGSEVGRPVKFGIAGPATDAPPYMSDAAPNSDAATATQALVLIQDNWVCCDECQRWRLLPYGTNPEDLPKKWRCSMQFWLPGLNNCNVSEDETTKAFHELYPVPVPVSDTNLTSHLDAAASTVTSAGPFNPDRRLENNMNDAPLSRNKKHASMDGIDFPNDSSLTQLPKSSRNLQVAFQNKCLNNVGYCLETDSKLMPSYKDGGATEKHLYKPTEKHKFMSYYKGGKAKHSKPMCKREADVYGQSSSKKCKKDNSCHSLKGLDSILGTPGKIAANRDGNLDKAPKSVTQSYSDHSCSKNFMSKSASSRKSIDPVIPSSHRKHGELCSSSHAEKPNKYDSNCKKRKLKELQEKQVCKKISMSGQLSVGPSPKIKEHLVPSDLRRQKKAKIAKYEEKRSHAVVGSGRIETTNIIPSNGKHLLDDGGVQPTTEDQLVHYQGNAMLGQGLDCMDGVKRNVRCAHPLAAAAASSSSKVSGSQKSKKTLPDLRESPVGSVSSSPLRVIKTENIFTKRNSSMKDNVVHSGIVSQKGSSYGKIYGNGSQLGIKINDPASFASLKSLEVYKSSQSGARKSFKDPYDYMGAETNALAVVSNIGSKMTKHDDVMPANLHEPSILFGDVNPSPQSKKCQLMQLDNNHAFEEVKHCASGQKKPGKGFLCSRDKEGILDMDAGGRKLKVFRSSRHKELHSFQSTIHKADMEFDLLNSNGKCDLESHSKLQIDNDLSFAIAGRNKGTPGENLQQEQSNGKQKPPDLLISVEIDRSVNGSGKGMQPSHAVKDRLGKKGPISQKVPESNKGTSLEQYHVDAVKNVLKSSKLSRKIDELNGMHSNLDLQPIAGVPGSSPTKNDVHSSVHSLIKEARDLKHTATRLKNAGFVVESSGLFFESALTFLHAASHMELSNVENARQGDLVPSSQILQLYYETAKFFEFCAHEFEKLKKMAAASLAYKCTEVAYWKVAYYKQPSASKVHAELQVTLDAAFPGESSSSSASDVDNLNNQGGFDKASSVKAVGSPQVASSLAIAAHNRPHIIRLLTYTNQLNCAFEASKKSQNAIAIASNELGKSSIDAVCSVREVIDFNFHNVEGLLHLVRQSMNSISL
ncbi:hypothetical protein HPP92_002729 [Vanilla planifolia]|uniref:CW-type domain-containing protein n=1 Tax=Vanilla planifolia TaxID=51239 RepID=A0A835VKU9_VANPL|nr:hypothetical protein HPP92_002729 [Vanilla planifolia]